VRLALGQIDTTVGDFEGNVARIRSALDRSRALSANLVLFPELAVTGYPPMDLLERPAFVEANLRALDDVVRACRGLSAVVGFVPPAGMVPACMRVSAWAAGILVDRKADLAALLTREMGKVLKETRGDVQEAIDTGYYMAGEGRRLFGPTVPSELPNKFAMAVRQSIGVCGMITPWNFPMAISSWKLLPAVVCGNTCVIKPAQDTPLSTFNLVQALTDAGIPKGVINIVTGCSCPTWARK